jgi:hypothetical protein
MIFISLYIRVKKKKETKDNSNKNVILKRILLNISMLMVKNSSSCDFRKWNRAKT